MALGKAYAFWPDGWMPAPQEDSWSFQPEDLREATETEVGAIIRPQFDSDILTADCTLVLNRMQSAWFEAFEKAMNHESCWFIFPIWYGGCLRDGMVMFKDRPKWTVEAMTTTYKFSVLVQKRSLEFDPCIMEMLWCWTPDESAWISKAVADAVSALNGSTILPDDIGD